MSKNTLPTIKIGSEWTLITHSPFEANPLTVTILDVQSGWVKYQMPSGAKNGMSVGQFVQFYELVDWPEEIEV